MSVSLELSAQRAWPALDSQIIRGWMCRTAAGYTQRANSCLPLEGPEDDHAARIPEVEAYFARKNLPAVFKIPDEPAWAALDQTLARRGYSAATPSQVLSKAIEPRSGSTAFRSDDSFDHSWWEGFTAANGLTEPHAATARALALRVDRPTVARVVLQGKDAAWAFASLVGDEAWIFDVVVDPSHRRQGLGRTLMEGLEAAVARNGARHLHLQVLAANTVARALYDTLGFTPSYSYHYRRQA